MLLEHLGDARTACVGAWSLRRINDVYNGPVVRLRRSTDNAEQDFWRGTGNAFYSSTKQTLTAWLGAATAFVVTWYDQSGQANNATTSSTTQQPTLVTNPDWSVEPTLRFDGTDFLSFNGAGMVNTNYSVFASFARASVGAHNYVLGGTASATNSNFSFGYNNPSTTFVASQWSNDVAFTVPAFTTRSGVVAAARHSTSLAKNAFVNGASAASLANTQSLTSWAGAAIGRWLLVENNGGPFCFNGDISEIVLVAQYLDNRERALLETDMMRVTQSPVTAVPVPAVCYSLRRFLGSGPVVRLERGGDAAQDDFFASTGVDTLVNGAGQTPETWAGANAVYVHTWYNQVVNANHAVSTIVGTAVKPTLARGENNEYVVRMVNSSSTNGSYLAIPSYTWNRTTRGFTSVTRSNKLGWYERVYQLDNGTSSRRITLFRHSETSQLRSLIDSVDQYTTLDAFPAGSATMRTVTARVLVTSGSTVTTDAWVDAARASAGWTATVPDFTSTRGGIGFTGDAAFFATMDITDAVFFNATLSDRNVDVWRGLVANPQPSTAATPGICYSLRRFLGTGPVVRLERGGDAAQADFFSRGTLLLNAAGQTPEAWAGANVAYVHTWFNQAANANHAVATVVGAAVKPTLARESNEYVVRLVNSSASNGSYLNFGAYAWNLRSSGFTSVSRVNKIGSYGRVYQFGGGTQNLQLVREAETSSFRLIVVDSGNNVVDHYSSATFPTSSPAMRTLTGRLRPTGASTAEAAASVDGNKTSASYNVTLTDTTPTLCGIGYKTDSAFFVTMDISDMVFFNAALSDADVVSWCGAVGNPPPTVATIPRLMSAGQTCPLDLVSSASRAACRGAYGLRSLSSTYTGPALRVRRASDNAETDIFAAGDRMLVRLDPATGKPQSLTAWLAGNAATLVTWYDQSGAGNHSTAVNGGVVVSTSKAQGNNPPGLWQLSMDPPAYVDALTDAGAACQGVWSLRNVRTAYTGALVRLRRSTDNAELDFWRGGAGTFFYNPTGDLASWLGSATAFVATWYDQSGRNNHATQATAASQPQLVLAPDWSAEPTLRFDGTDDSMAINGNGMVNTNYSVFASFARNSSKNYHYLLGGTNLTDDNMLLLGYRSDTVFTFAQISNDINVSVPSFTTRSPVVAVARHSSDLFKNLYLNGVLGSTSVNATPLSSWTGAAIGGMTHVAQLFTGDISEIVMMSRYVTDAERAAVERAMISPPPPQYVRVPASTVAAYDRLTVALTAATTPVADKYLVYARAPGPLDKLSATSKAAVQNAYSLRSVNATYTGAIVRLRRSTDNAEDDFWRGAGTKFYNSAGTTLTVWLGAATAFVVTWYDQSGRGNHATTSTTAQQPILVTNPDWSAEPTLRFDGTGDFLSFNGAGMVNTNYTAIMSFTRGSNKNPQWVLGNTTTSGNNGMILLGYDPPTGFTHAQYGNDYSAAVSAFSSRTTFVAAVRHSSTLGKNMHLNGAFAASRANTTSLGSWASPTIGRFATYYFEGDISEIVLVSRYVGDDERFAVESAMIGGTAAASLPASKFNLSHYGATGNVQTSVGWETTPANRAISTTAAARTAVVRWASVNDAAGSKVYADGALQATATRVAAVPAWTAADEVYVGGAPGVSSTIAGEVRTAYFFDAALTADQISLLA